MVQADKGAEEMTEKIDNGGAAFPCEGGNSSGLIPDPGMSLRDWFAGQALAGLTANSVPGSHHHPSQIVRDAFHLADLMLASRAISRTDEQPAKDSA